MRGEMNKRGIFFFLERVFNETRLAPSSRMDSGKTTEWITKTATHVRRFRRRGESRRTSADVGGNAISPAHKTDTYFSELRERIYNAPMRDRSSINNNLSLF